MALRCGSADVGKFQGPGVNLCRAEIDPLFFFRDSGLPKVKVASLSIDD
jgi:hypothetical protein